LPQYDIGRQITGASAKAGSARSLNALENQRVEWRIAWSKGRAEHLTKLNKPRTIGFGNIESAQPLLILHCTSKPRLQYTLERGVTLPGRMIEPAIPWRNGQSALAARCLKQLSGERGQLSGVMRTLRWQRTQYGVQAVGEIACQGCRSDMGTAHGHPAFLVQIQNN
jgi:hypothetical protein